MKAENLEPQKAQNTQNGFLEKLLDGAEVEWVPLGEVAEIKRGKRLVKSQLVLHKT